MTIAKNIALLVLVTAALVFATPVRADEDERDAGENYPVSAVLERFHAEFGDADVLEVELEPEQLGGKQSAIYEIKAFTKRGAVLKVYYDARTLKRLQVKGRREHDD